MGKVGYMGRCDSTRSVLRRENLPMSQSSTSMQHGDHLHLRDLHYERHLHLHLHIHMIHVQLVYIEPHSYFLVLVAS